MVNNMLSTLKKIINYDITNSSTFCLIEKTYIVYLSGVIGNFNKNINLKDFFILIKDNTTKNKSMNSIVIYNSDYESMLNSEDQLLIIHKNFYQNLGMPNVNDSSMNSLLINSLFESIKTTKRPIYALLSLVNFIGSEIYICHKKEKFEEIKRVIKTNASNAHFNLNELCSIIFMSKRKVQYIISDNNQTFLHLLHQYRVDELKSLIKQNGKMPILTISYLSGFSCYATANRTFKHHVGMSIKDYINESQHLDLSQEKI
ncbi:helix-turn-helix domain-containing protein [Aliivibrio fischeri]|uniref:Helix-turn-helix domain-containing protein n=3 Tax=Aliivibrio fischeri TaxID=668 RepID=A0A844P0I0_ALIFS|nr:helix-turn-helix domain-containing protein [Aliivibrio fischeri]